MTTGKILLARPNSFIVKHMKRLVQESGNIPIPLNNIKELDSINGDHLRAIVISTSVSSVVKEGYFDVLDLVKQRYGTKPVFLATLTEVDSVKRAFHQNKDTSNLILQSVEEACEKQIYKSIVVIRKNDLMNDELFEKTLSVLRRSLG